MENTVIEFPGNIDFCPYCGSTNLEADCESITCNDCGHDFTVLTHN